MFLVRELICPFDKLVCGRSGHCLYYSAKLDLMCHPCSRFDIEKFYDFASLRSRSG